MKSILLTATLLIFSNLAFTQSLWINDPQNWNGGQGTIEETSITFEPQGLFMKVNWEITFSAEGLEQFSEKDTVEVVYNFNLPEGAMIIDSWLWFGDSILEGMIMDRWSANQVYESIVNRRRDPSILYKNWNTNYELRIFPMAAKESRKVKLTFLTPADWSEKSVKSHLLSENLLVSKNPIDKIDVYAKLSSSWKNPVIIGGEENITIDPELDTEIGTTHHKALHFKQLARGQKFVLDSPLKNGYHLSFYENGEEKFYQLAMYPAEGMNIRKPQKVLFFIDYQKENSELSQVELLNNLKVSLTDLLNEKDSFNILFHDFELQMASDNWISGDSATIAKTINSLGEEPFVSYSNLATLLASGIEFAKKQGECKIVLLANSNKLSDVESANQLIEDLIELMDPVIPFYIGDYQTNIYRYNWIQNFNYRGNEYFYRNLAKLTGGDYVHSFDGLSFTDCMQSIYQLATNEASLIDIHTTLDSGFCYGRYILSKQNTDVLSNIYLETGRYSGDFPFEVEVSGMYDGDIFSKKLSINKEDAFQSDSASASFWHGNKIMEMENSGDAYSLINDIIDISIDNRILSKYTAFLCLEPGMMGELDNIIKDDITRGWEDGGGVIISAEETEARKFEIKAYPNPFSDKVTINVSLPKGTSIENTQMEIYDLFGKRITIFNIDKYNGQTEIMIEWDAKDNSGGRVSKGTYILICTTPEKRISKKLILM